MISSPGNERVVKAARLHGGRYRRETGQTLLEGPNVVAAALAAGAAISQLFTLEPDRLSAEAAASGVAVATVTEPVMGKLAGTDHPRGPVAVMSIPTAGGIDCVDTILLCGVADPGNAGTLIRSAAAFSFQVVATRTTVDLWSPKVLRAAAGAHFATEIVVARAVREVAVAGVHLVALVPHDDGTPDPGPGLRPIGLMVGNEAKGLTPGLIDRAEATLTIPTSGSVESLNAAVAGSIAMFATAQMR